MSSSREGPNPLRPYYVPPSIGLSPGPTSNAAAAANASASSSAKAFGSSARDLLSDLDYSDYLESSPSISDWVRDILDRGVWRYASVLTAQPFDVAKTILQVYVVPDGEDGQIPLDDRRTQSQGYREQYYEDDSQSSDDESSYFTSAAPATTSPSTPRSRGARHRITDRNGYIPPPGTSPRQLAINNPSSLMEVLSQLWSTSGPTSIWKGANATFIYSLLLPTLNTFIRSLLSAILGLPEEAIASPMTADILTAASPGTTLILSFVSSALSSILLSPIDTARTFLILTPLTHGPRSLLRAIRLLPTPTYMIPPHLVPITILHSSLPNLLSTSTPLLLKSYLSLDPVLNPSTWSLFTFLASGLELGIKFPLETVLRRAQITTFTSPSLRQKSLSVMSPTTPSPTTASKAQTPDVETIVPTPRSYRGVIGTMWSIIHEEGVSPSPSEGERAHELLGKSVPRKQRRRQGQGIQGLYRGWRVGMWGLAGIWGAGFLGAAMGGGEEEIITGTAASGMGPVGARGGRASAGVF